MPDAAIVFRVITLWEPPKAEMVPFLDLEHGGNEMANPPARVARVQAYIDKVLSEFKVHLDQKAVIAHESLHVRHSHIDADYMRRAELACLADSRVKEHVAALRLPEGATVIAEPWTYGTDGVSDTTGRVTMVWLVTWLITGAFLI